MGLGMAAWPHHPIAYALLAWLVIINQPLANHPKKITNHWSTICHTLIQTLIKHYRTFILLIWPTVEYERVTSVDPWFTCQILYISLYNLILLGFPSSSLRAIPRGNRFSAGESSSSTPAFREAVRLRVFVSRWPLCWSCWSSLERRVSGQTRKGWCAASQEGWGKTDGQGLVNGY